MREAVIVVDMIIEFVYGRFGNQNAQSIIPAIHKLLAAARETGRSVVFVEDHHLPNDPELRVHGPHAMKGTPEAEPIAEIQPLPDEQRIEKRSYSGFRNTNLDLVLRSLGVETVVIIGVTTGGCVLHTAYEAFALGYDVIVPENCVSARTDEAHKDGLFHMKQSYGVILTTSSSLIQNWQPRSLEEDH